MTKETRGHIGSVPLWRAILRDGVCNATPHFFGSPLPALVSTMIGKRLLL